MRQFVVIKNMFCLFTKAGYCLYDYVVYFLRILNQTDLKSQTYFPKIKD